MKNFGILMALLVMSCGLLISSASAEPARLPQIGDNSIDYYSIPDRQALLAGNTLMTTIIQICCHIC